jgi:hypothetical protein
MEDRCIHSLEQKNCFYCNGDYFKQKTVTKRTNENYELQEKYERIKDTFRNFRELWTEEEILTVYEDFINISKKEKTKMAYITAIKLGRTKKAILWMYLHIFSEKSNLHRGKEVIKFRKEFGLV